ncbi:class I SAM-dependent methyltransferase [Gilvimarinus agarilyticus]|uniref:class I SAM-dependent methyltransferase n=1 Tax=Gilvimarinus sp. 2_MG-2023 TaxID=3062666 RepID=UPI001C0937AD|nr:class I SAM-dependent methyltransferase [Gilvimarinus sp. 2_MG-2023]MBU2886557.1 class I SAM-dependent methyltransferase [Gilvimarinus agarilyticus]MDO6571225.1 class I SAM-dependent methyltransferase [Gilvimarinus sp. 2_MG-2023]
MWDQRYQEEGFAYGTVPNDFLRTQCDQIPSGGRVLCLAEGEGRNAVYLAQQGFVVTAVDQSAVGLEKAQRLAEEKGTSLTTKVADLADYDLGFECWDGIISIWAHVPPVLRQQLHRQVVHALKKGGVFILEAYTRRQLDMSGVGGPPASQPEMFMSRDELMKELQGLEFCLAVEQERNISEGRCHQGESAVVQLVASRPVVKG